MQRDCVFLASPLPARIPHPAELALPHPAPSPSPPAEPTLLPRGAGWAPAAGVLPPADTLARGLAIPLHPTQACPNLGRHRGSVGQAASPSPHPLKCTVALARPAVPRGLGDPEESGTMMLSPEGVSVAFHNEEL